MKNGMKLKLWMKIFLVGLIPILSASIILSMSLYNAAEQKASTISKNAVSDQVKRIDLSINTRVRLIETSLISLSNILSTNSWKNDSSPKSLAIFTENMMTPFSEIRSAVIALNNGLLFCTDKNPEVKISTLNHLREEAETDPGKIFIAKDNQSLFQSSRSSKCFYMYTAVVDQSTNSVNGIAIFEISYQILGINMLSQQRIQQSQTIFLLNEDKELIYSDNYLPNNICEKIVQYYNMGNRKFMLDFEDKQYYVYMLYSGTTGWIIASFLPGEKLFPQALALKQETITIFAIVVILSTFFLCVLSKIILKPIQVLKNAMLSVKDKHLHIHVDITSTDEIGELASAFNYMVETLTDLIDQNYKQKIATQTAEMKALQAQINPHFLYNTLDSINWMLIDHQEYDLSNIIVAFGKLMRYSMQTQKSIVTLKDEYDNVLDYLTLQQFRLENKLKYSLILDPEIEGFNIPKLILQPLVENSIIHGILPLEKSGTISVNTSIVSNYIQIDIKDTGVGMNAQELIQFRSLFIPDKSHENIGVSNVVQRLRLFYGNTFTINAYSTVNKGTQVIIRLPILRG